MDKKIYIWESKVRDYELDSQGIVNNATYVNYFEQCRNDYARSLGIDFYEYHQLGFDLVVASIEIQYRAALKVGDEFYVTAKFIDVTDKRINFEQEIRSRQDKRLFAKAAVHVACVDIKAGKSYIPALLKDKIININTSI